MSKVRAHCFGVSLDGFSAGPNQSLQHPLGERGIEIMQWMFPTQHFHRMQKKDGGETGVDNAMVEKGFDNVGAWILGRNMFGPVRGPWPDETWKGWWGDEPPYRVPVFVLTHYARAPIPMKGGTEFRFVTGDYRYEYDLASQKLKQLGRALRGPQLPPEVLAGMTEEQRDRLRELQQRRRDDDDRQDDQQQERREDQQQQEQQEGTRPPAGGRPGTPNYKAYAPDKKKYVYAYKYNLYLAEEGKEDKAVQLTKDGAEEYSFAGGGFGFGGTRRSDGDPQPPAAQYASAAPTMT